MIYLLVDWTKQNNINLSKNILEPCCGEGHLSKRLLDYSYNVKSFDLVDRGFGEVFDFFSFEEKFDGDIITNPPYKDAQEFVEHSLNVLNDDRYSCMFLKLTFLESKKRKEFFENNPPKYILVCRSRVTCAKGGDFATLKNTSTTICYAWFIWQKGFLGKPTIDWIN